MLVYAIKGSDSSEFGTLNLKLRHFMNFMSMNQSAFCYFSRNI